MGRRLLMRIARRQQPRSSRATRREGSRRNIATQFYFLAHSVLAFMEIIIQIYLDPQLLRLISQLLDQFSVRQP